MTVPWNFLSIFYWTQKIADNLPWIEVSKKIFWRKYEFEYNAPLIKIQNCHLYSDIDECNSGIGFSNCHLNANCINLPGTFDCSCFGGFFGDGFLSGTGCVDINECITGASNCHSTVSYFITEFQNISQRYSKNILQFQ